MNTCYVTSKGFVGAEKYYGQEFLWKACHYSPFTNVHLKIGRKWECFWRGFTSLDTDGSCPVPASRLPRH